MRSQMEVKIDFAVEEKPKALIAITGRASNTNICQFFMKVLNVSFRTCNIIPHLLIFIITCELPVAIHKVIWFGVFYAQFCRGV